MARGRGSVGPKQEDQSKRIGFKLGNPKNGGYRKKGIAGWLQKEAKPTILPQIAG